MSDNTNEIIEKRFNAQVQIYKIEKDFEWRSKWMHEIPFINFPSHWLVQVIPPFAAAVVRFQVRRKDMVGEVISVYLDCYDMLGAMGKPYWEIYPSAGEDTERYPMEDIKGFLDGIERALHK